MFKFAVTKLNNVINHGVYFVVTPCTYTPSLQAVDAVYAAANARHDCSQEVVFEEREITLAIPVNGLWLENGWTITPLTHPGVSLFYDTISVCYCKCSN